MFCPLVQLKIKLGLLTSFLFGPESTWTSTPKIVPTPLILFGSSPPVLVHVLYFQGRIRNAERKYDLVLSWIRGRNIFLGRLVRSSNSFYNKKMCIAVPIFGQIDFRKQVLGRFRSHFQTNFDILTLRRHHGRSISANKISWVIGGLKLWPF
jgi:hypothetical protein